MQKISQLSLLLFVLLLIIPILPLLGYQQQVSATVTEPSDDTTVMQQEQEDTPIEQDTVEEVAVEDDFSETVTVFRTDTDKQEEMTMRDYLIGVVFSEMPATFHEEAIKAQTVVAYTYATYQLQDSDSLTDSPATHQAYQDIETLQARYGDSFEEYYDKIAACVDAVYPEILTYDDQPILAAFHSVSTGYTESSLNVWGGDLPYLIAVESVGDPDSAQYTGSTSLSKAEVYEILMDAYPDLVLSEQPSDWFSIQSYTASNYVDTVLINTTTVSGQTMRTLFSLRSAAFSISYDDGVFTFDTVGYGHGVGMSQYGAEYYANQGWSYDEILAHYYPGTTLVEVA